MNASDTCTATRDSVLARLAEDYLISCEAGQPLTSDELAKRYPELASDVAACLASLNFIRQAAATDPMPSASRGEFALAMLDNYELLEEIGRGGMGVVYRARQTKLNRPVAIKMIRAGHLATPAQIERFTAEAEAAASLDHPHIVSIYEIGQQAGQHYFSMKLIEGGNLAETRISGTKGEAQQKSEVGNRKAEICDAAKLIVTVADAVHYAHQRGILHRDLKPSNILIDGNGQPYVTDFGLAKRVEAQESMTLTGDILGTPLYMAPEQAAGDKHLTTAADIYSLGAILYWLLTAKPAFQAATPLETLRQVQEQEPVSPRLLNSVIDRDLETICLKCLEKAPQRRYTSAAALADDLNRWLGGEAIFARPLSRSERALRCCRKSPLITGLAAAVVFLAVAGLAGVLSQWQLAVASEQKAIANEERAVVSEQQALANEQKAVVAAAAAQEKAQEANQQRDEAQRQRDEVKALAEKLAANEKQLQNTLYAAHMNLAKHAWDAGGTERVLDLLAQHRPQPGERDLRGFEWHYLNRLCNAGLVTLSGHTAFVTAVAFSSDRRRLATVSYDRSLKVWDIVTGKELLRLKGHTGTLVSVAFSPDGKHVASASLLRAAQGKPLSGELKVWDSVTGQETLTIEGHDVGMWGLAYSPDGKRLASATYDKSKDSYDVSIRIRDADSCREIFTLKDTGYVHTIAFSPDGKRLACGTGGERDAQGNDVPGELKLWNIENGQELFAFKARSGRLRSVAFSPDGLRVAGTSTSIGTIKLWNAQTGEEILTFRGHTDEVNSIVFSSDGKLLASASNDQKVKVWDVETGQETLTLKGHIAPVGSVVFTADGRHVASTSVSSDLTVRVKTWDVQLDRSALTSKANSGEVAFSPDGKRLAEGGWDRMVKVWDADTGQEMLICKGHNAPVLSVSFSPDGKRLASASYDHMVKVWDAQSGQDLLSLKGHTNRLHDVAWSPDGKRLASASWDSTVKVWDAEMGQTLHSLKGHKGAVFGVAFSPGGKRLASASSDRTVKLWDADSGQEIAALKGAQGNCVRLAFSPDGKRLACGSADKTVLVWDIETGQQLLALKGHSGTVHRLAFSSDGTRLATGSHDKTVKVWDAQTGQEVLTLTGTDRNGLQTVAFSPDGHRLASGSGYGTIMIYDATPLPEKP